MYSIYMDGSPTNLCIYDKGFLNPERNVISPKLSTEDNKAGSLEFAVTQNHTSYSIIEPMKTTIHVYRDRKKIWEGRVLSAERAFNNQKAVYVEGALSYFNDSTQESKKYANCTLKTFITNIVGVHNKQVPENRKIYIGDINDADSIDYDEDKKEPVSIDRYTDFELTMDVLESIVNDYEGHMYITVNNSNNDRLELNYKKYEKPSSEVSQKINFGKNLLDFVEKIDYSEYATVLLPLGESIDDGDEDSNLKKYLTIEGGTAPTGYEIVSPVGDPQSAKKYLKHIETYNKFGWICQTEQWDEAKTKSDLIKLAKKHIEEIQKKHVSIELKVIDLHYLDTNVVALNMYDSVRAISYPHGMNDVYMVTRMEIPFDSPDNTSITLGFEVDKALSAITSSNNSSTKSEIKAIPTNSKQNKALSSTVVIDDEAHSTVENALSALNGSTTITESSLNKETTEDDTTYKWSYIKLKNGIAIAWLYYKEKNVTFQNSYSGSYLYTSDMKSAPLPKDVSDNYIFTDNNCICCGNVDDDTKTISYVSVDTTTNKLNWKATTYRGSISTGIDLDFRCVIFGKYT